MMSTTDKDNLESLYKSLKSKYDVIYEKNNRDTESLYRFGWFYINDYKYSISGWSFQKQLVTLEDENGNKVKYSIPNKMTVNSEFRKDAYFYGIKKKIKNNLADWLKDLSDKLRD